MDMFEGMIFDIEEERVLWSMEPDSDRYRRGSKRNGSKKRQKQGSSREKWWSTVSNSGRGSQRREDNQNLYHQQIRWYHVSGYTNVSNLIRIEGFETKRPGNQERRYWRIGARN
jgi:hypothetical protein